MGGVRAGGLVAASLNQVDSWWLQLGVVDLTSGRTGAVLAVTVDGGSVGRPTELFRMPGNQREWSVGADGQRFLVAAPVRQSDPSFTVVVNRQSALKH
jgi:hypothetical protein